MLLTAGGLPAGRRCTAAAAGGISSLVQFAVAAGIVLAAADFFVVMRRNRKKTRMTKQEVQDENKSSEGDPHSGRQRRARQMAMSRNRMIAAIADADVVLVNPTHVAVALQVRARQVRAPRWWPRAPAHVAARIREEAERERRADGPGHPAGPGAARGLRDRPGDPGRLLPGRGRRPGLRHGAQGPRRRRRACTA